MPSLVMSTSSALPESLEKGRTIPLGVVTHYENPYHGQLPPGSSVGDVDFVQVNLIRSPIRGGKRVLRAAADHGAAV